MIIEFCLELENKNIIMEQVKNKIEQLKKDGNVASNVKKIKVIDVYNGWNDLGKNALEKFYDVEDELKQFFNYEEFGCWLGKFKKYGIPNLLEVQCHNKKMILELEPEIVLEEK